MFSSGEKMVLERSETKFEEGMAAKRKSILHWLQGTTRYNEQPLACLLFVVKVNALVKVAIVYLFFQYMSF